MARSTQRPTSSSDGKSLTEIRRDLDNCTEQLARLRSEIEIHVKRMGAMQAEIDHLRSVIKG